MSANSRQEPLIRRFGSDETIRWSPRMGDFALWVRCNSVLDADNKEGWTIADYWQFRDGDYLTISNREQDLPAWFLLSWEEVSGTLCRQICDRMNAGEPPTEPMDGPNIWRPCGGDRLVLVRPSAGAQPILEILDLATCALVLGETSRPSLANVLEFGAPIGEHSKADAITCRYGFEAAVALGIPQTMSVEWSFGG